MASCLVARYRTKGSVFVCWNDSIFTVRGFCAFYMKNQATLEFCDLTFQKCVIDRWKKG